ncbi:hypothetical protein [Clostridium sp. C105KSO13]|uniref:hypothetical protein n=1 Tax=Clostridium sp. C105KSO13 TaxID=1776045 RepID=UPI0007406E14|nr:hypothetical protein [Clostridium sp. C105KSO13]CUX16386.1 hypothetical protein BN3456_00157 [Clostridium sp. C105KSO13]
MEREHEKLMNTHMTSEQHEKFQKFIMGDDMDFYEEYIINLSLEEQKEFFLENPNFLSGFQVNYNKIELLKDKVYRNLLRKIRDYERRGVKTED